MANKIILKKSSVASKVPLATDLEIGEIAVNLADQKLYSKNASGSVVLVGTGTATGTVTGVTATSPVASSGGTAPVISLASGYGDTQNPFASKTANYVLAAPNGTAGAPTFRAIVAADIPTLNQNTTGTAAGLSSTLAISSGGTGATSAAAALTALGAQAAATAITTSNIGSQSVSYATSAGSATTATSATSATTATSSPLVSSISTYSWSASTLPPAYSMGIQSSFVSSSQGFQNYGSVMTMNTYSGGGGALQMFVPYSPTYGGTGMQIRFGNYDVSGGNSWTSWKTVLASDNYSSYCNFGTNSVYGGIYYDGSNTAYYVDPASTSNLSTAIFTGQVYSNAAFRPRYSAGSDSYSGHFDWYGLQLGNNGGNYIVAGRTTAGGSLLVYTNNTSDFPTINGVLSAKFDNDGHVYNYYSTRSPYFYDSDNTSYYLNPAATSVLYNVGSYYLSNNGSVSTDNTYGMYFDSGLSTAYAIFRESGSWVSPYPNLRIAFHTGISIGANPSYGGVNFFTDYDMATYVMSVNNGSYGGASSVYVHSTLYAPIMYDANNTGYYCDPASTSNFSTVTAAALTAAGFGFAAGNTQNLKITSAAAGAVGISGYNSSGTWCYQLYADGSNYGFLNGNWAGWDLQKAINGQLLLTVSGTQYTAIHTGNVSSYAATQSAGGVVLENGQTISSNYTMTSGKSGISAGPITIATGVTVTIPTGSNWVIA